MKCWTGVLLLLAVLLCGCNNTSPEATSTAPGTTPATQEQTAPQQTQEATEGQQQQALTAFSLESDKCTGIATMGADVLLFEKDTLTILNGTTLEQEVTAQIPGIPAPDSGLVKVREDGVAYFDAAQKCIVYLGVNLSETLRLQLPEDMIGTACLSPDWSMVYYCTDSAVRALDMSTGVSHLVKEQTAHFQSVTGVLLDGAVLRCTEQKADGTVRTALLSAETGELLYEGSALSGMISGEDRYFLCVDHKSVTEMVFGTPDGKPQVLWAAAQDMLVGVLPNADGVVIARQEKDGLWVDRYDLTTGLRTAMVCLGQQEEVCGFAADIKNGVLWLHSGQMLYRWEPALSPSGDTMVYTASRDTREQPNEAALVAVQQASLELEERYQVELLLWKEAEQVTPWDYTFDTEYLAQAYDKAFDTLNRVMAQFPENFYVQAAERSANKKMTIVLVRGIYGAPENGTLASAGGIQYWLDGNLYMALSMGDELERYFYHEMGHVIDTRVLSTSTAFYEWEKLNPPSFQYDNDYIANQDRQDEQYLRDSDRWFIDTYSMSFAVEDRSRILEYASLPGNEAYFQSSIMQQKLQRICTGIRQAFGLETDERQFVWEQYLKQ